MSSKAGSRGIQQTTTARCLSDAAPFTGRSGGGARPKPDETQPSPEKLWSKTGELLPGALTLFFPACRNDLHAREHFRPREHKLMLSVYMNKRGTLQALTHVGVHRK